MLREVISIFAIGLIILGFGYLLFGQINKNSITNDELNNNLSTGSISNHSFILGITAWLSPDCDVDAHNMVDAGINYVRVPISWKSIEPTEGNFDFSYYDNLFDCLDRYNLNYMVVLEYWIPPQWAQEKWDIPKFHEYTGTLSDHSFIEAYTRFVSNIAEHYKGRVKIYQVANELNNDLQIILGIRFRMKEASEFIRIGFDAVKIADPDAMVTTGLARSRNWKVFLEDYVIDYEDIFSIHMYGVLDEIHRDSLYALSFGKPVIFGETGKSMCPGHATADEQADFIHNMIKQAYSDGVDGLFIFNYRDSECPESCNIDLGHCMGVIDERGNPKPAYYSLQRITSELS